MEDAARDRAITQLVDAVSLWRVSPRHAGEVIDAATSCLVVGLDTPALRELAGESPADSSYVVEELIRRCLEELAMSDVLERDLELAAATAMIRRFLAGSVSARELASWAHQVIGHDGASSLQPFVMLDDEYDLLGVDGTTEADLDAFAHADAVAFLDGRPSPRPSVRALTIPEGLEDLDFLIRWPADGGDGYWMPQGVGKIRGPRRWRGRYRFFAGASNREVTVGGWEQVERHLQEANQLKPHVIYFESAELRERVTRDWGEMTTELVDGAAVTAQVNASTDSPSGLGSAMVIDVRRGVSLGVPDDRAMVRVPTPPAPPGTAFPPRRLTLRGQEIFDLALWCGTCPAVFTKLGEPPHADLEVVHERLNVGLQAIDDEVLSAYGQVLPEAEYTALLLEVRPQLVSPGDPGDYFAREQVATWGINAIDGVEDPATPYYRTFEASLGSGQHLFEFVVPMVPPTWNSQERVDDYLRSDDEPGTAVAYSLLDVVQPAMDQGENHDQHWVLTHFLLDGHHKMEAAARAHRSVRLLSIVDERVSLAEPDHLDTLVRARS